MNGIVTHRGGCHCGAVVFEVQAAADIVAEECNCSICNMTGFQHLIVTRDAFKLLEGEGDLATYTFNTGQAKHFFCRHCGIKSFYIPRSHPEGYSINVRCLDRASIRSVSLRPFDGRNWEDSVDSIR